MILFSLSFLLRVFHIYHEIWRLTHCLIFSTKTSCLIPWFVSRFMFCNRAQVVGWPPIRSLHKNKLTTNLSRNNDVKGKSESSCLYVKVSMDGAPYLRKVDLKTYCSYAELSSALEKMFSCFTIGTLSLSPSPHVNWIGILPPRVTESLKIF